MPDHKSTSCRPNPPATTNTTALPDRTASRPHFVQTNRKKTALLYEKNVYYSDSAKHWRCQYRKRMNCKAACHIKDNTVLSNNIAHVHRAKTDEEIRMFDVIADVKNKAVEQPEEKPYHIIAASMNNHFEAPPKEVRNNRVRNLRTTIYRTRRKTFKPVPKQRQACLARLKEMAGEDDLVRSVNGNVVMIARRQDLEHLNVSKLALFADGTFKYSPRFFNQMYTFFVFSKGQYLPVVHFLLINKTQATYLSMINMLIAECRSAGFSIQENLKGGTIMLDFEKAMINAATISFPGCKVQGCRFHLGQS